MGEGGSGISDVWCWGQKDEDLKTGAREARRGGSLEILGRWSTLVVVFSLTPVCTLLLRLSGGVGVHGHLACHTRNHMKWATTRRCVQSVSPRLVRCVIDHRPRNRSVDHVVTVCFRPSLFRSVELSRCKCRVFYVGL